MRDIIEKGVTRDVFQSSLQAHQQDTGCTEENRPVRLRKVALETHLIADELPQLRAALLGDPVRDSAGRDPPRLGVGDPLPARQQADLRELGGLARPGFTGDHDHLVVTDEGRDPRRLRGDRQRRVEGEPRLRVHLPWVM